MSAAKYLFGFEAKINRSTYIIWGVVLAAIKFGGDFLILKLFMQHTLTLSQFLSPYMSHRIPHSAPTVVIFLSLLWLMPFVWIGFSFSMRRARDAGISAWWALLFVMPFVNYGLILLLSIIPTSKPIKKLGSPVPKELLQWCTPLNLAIFFVVVGPVWIYLSVQILSSYSAALFIGAPFMFGLIDTYVLLQRKYSYGQIFRHILVTLLLICAVLMLFAIEGLICVAMAFPPALVLATLGSIFGYGMYKMKAGKVGAIVSLIFFVPLGMIMESQFNIRVEDQIRTSLLVEAPPEVVWEHVVSFSEIPETNHWLFKTGIAYPKQARIVGQGVGAVRYCEFSTGAFKEPITQWDEPFHLAFDVESQPPTMDEWSLYENLNPPHLSGFYQSKRGAFELIETAEGDTLLVGTTWVEMDIHPSWYWKPYSRFIVHKIHETVLDHIKGLAEQELLHPTSQASIHDR